MNFDFVFWYSEMKSFQKGLNSFLALKDYLSEKKFTIYEKRRDPFLIIDSNFSPFF